MPTLTEKQKAAVGAAAATVMLMIGYAWIAPNHHPIPPEDFLPTPRAGDAASASPAPPSAPPFPQGHPDLSECIQTWLRGEPLPIEGWAFIGTTCNHFEVWALAGEAHLVSIGEGSHIILDQPGLTVTFRRTWDDCDCDRNGVWDGRDVQAYVQQVIAEAGS